MESHQIRLQNVETIIRKRFDGKRVRLAEAIDKNPVTVNRWFSVGTQGRRIGHKTARTIEETLGLATGWLDSIHTETSDLEIDPKKKHFLKTEHGQTYDIPLLYSATLNQQYQLSIINNKKGKLMLLSTDSKAYAFQLLGHNPNQLLNKNWGLVVEPDTPLTEDEYALLYLSNGEILLRMLTYQDSNKLLVSHPVTGEQQEILRSQIDQALYCYIGIPPSKIIVEESDI